MKLLKMYCTWLGAMLSLFSWIFIGVYFDSLAVALISFFIFSLPLTMYLLTILNKLENDRGTNNH